MERRDFFQHVTALAVGVTGAAGLDIDRLTALKLPDLAGAHAIAGVAELRDRLTTTAI